MQFTYHYILLLSYYVVENVNRARNSLGPYCMTVCKAMCCRRGQLLLEQVDASHIDINLLPDERGYVTVSLENACPKLTVDSKCSIYENRPKPCREYPLYPKGKLLLVAQSCQGVQTGQIDFSELEKEYRIEFI